MNEKKAFNNNGFTLVEVAIGVAIAGILTVSSVAGFQKVSEGIHANTASVVAQTAHTEAIAAAGSFDERHSVERVEVDFNAKHSDYTTVITQKSAYSVCVEVTHDGTGATASAGCSDILPLIPPIIEVID